MSAQSSQEYVILPINLAEDIPVTQSVFTRAFDVDSLSGDIARSNTSTEQAAFAALLRATRQRGTLEGRNKDGMRSIVGKLVHEPSGEILGVVCLLAPGDENTAALEPYPLVPEGTIVPEGSQAALDTWTSFNEQTDTRSEEILGPNRSKEWWYLSALAVSPDHQRKGLGGRLVRWSLEQARKDVEARRHLGIKGMWLIASEAGLRTYEKEGMKVIGDGWLRTKEDITEGKKGRHFTWLTIDM